MAEADPMQRLIDHTDPPIPDATVPDLTVLILTFNEARHIERAIASVRSIARSIIVLDSFSTDDTVALALAAGAQVHQHAFVNQAQQFQWGLDSLPLDTEWIMRLDADELIEPDLAEAIAARLPTLAADISGINLDRKHVFMGRWIRHGGRYPLRLLRLWRRGHAAVEQRWMDEHVTLNMGRAITLKGGFADANLHDLTYFIAKHNGYATREALDVLSREYGLIEINADCPAFASRQARTKRWIKERIYNRQPVWLGPPAYFLYRYVLQLGFLDGRAGLIYHVLQGFWYRFLVAAKVAELRIGIADCHGNDERRARLWVLTGLPV